MTELESAELRGIARLLDQLPSGIDDMAREDDASPEDATAHIGGLIWQRINRMLVAAGRRGLT